MRRWWWLVGLGLAVAFAVADGPAERTATMAELLSGQVAPLTLHGRDVTSGWLRLRLATKLNGVDWAAVDRHQGPLLGIAVTRGEVVRVGTVAFLVAYRPARPAPAAENEEDEEDDNPEASLRWLPDTRLDLALIKLDATIQVDRLAPVGPLGGSRPAGTQGQAVTRLKQVALAVMQYTQDYDERLPDFETKADLAAALMSYLRRATLLTDPVSGRPFEFNRRLSRRLLGHLISPAEMALAFQPQPAPDGTRAVAFADGHVKLWPESEWPLLQRRSRIPRPDEPVPPPPG